MVNLILEGMFELFDIALTVRTLKNRGTGLEVK